jgi:hypothetical protein
VGLVLFWIGIPVGFLLAVVVASMTEGSNLLKMSSTDLTTLLAGLGGALIGGIVSYAMTHAGMTHADRRDATQETNLQKVSSLAALLKAQQIANGIQTQKGYIVECREEANAAGMISAPLWRQVKIQVGNKIPAPIFATEELVPLMVSGNANLINECQIAALRYSGLISSFEAYNLKREELQKLIAPYSRPDVDGRVLTELPADRHAEYSVRELEVESLIRAIVAAIESDLPEAISLCKNLSQAYKKHFNDPLFVSLKTGG